MSENEANPGTGGMNEQPPPAAGESPQSGGQSGADAGEHGATYGSASPWSRPDAGLTASTPPGSPNPPTGHTPPAPPTYQTPSGHQTPPASQPGQEPTGYTVQLPQTYGANPSYPGGANYPPASSYPQPSYEQQQQHQQQPQSPFPQHQPAQSPYQPSYGQPYGPGTPYPTSGITPEYSGQTITGLPPLPPNGSESKSGRFGGRRGVVGIVAAATVAVALIAGGVGGFVGYALHPDDGVDNSALQDVSGGTARDAAPAIDRSSLAGVARTVQPMVVAVKTQGGEGSGVVISADGYIVTNNHVVASGTGTTVQVTFNSGKSVEAKIVGTDPKTDLAVVKADATGLVSATWADSDAVQVGDTVLAIGSPLGLQGSVTAGIVSALHRSITVGGDQQSPFQQPTGTTTIGDALQTDAPINPGNSGGALVDTNGKVVGINSAIATSGSNSTGNIGVGFAISANKAKSVTEQLIKGGKVSHPYVGISLGDAQDGGAQVQSVQAGSPAATAGIQEGDVIVKADSRSISNSEELVGAIQSSSPGTKMSLTLTRNGSQSTVTVTVGDQP